MNRPEPAKNRRELAREQTRDDLLDAGADLAWETFEAGRADPLRLLSPTEIAERAGAKRAPVTRGMLYHLWPSDDSDKLEGYRADLFLHIFEREYDPQGLRAAIARYLQGEEKRGQSPSLAGLVREVADFEFRRYAYQGDHASRFRFSTLMAIVGEALWRRGSLTDEQRDAISARHPYKDLANLYRELLDGFGREMVPPLEIEDLVEALWAMLDGFTLNSWHFDRVKTKQVPHAEATRGADAKGEDRPQDVAWSLFSLAVLAVVERFTRPKASEASDEAQGVSGGSNIQMPT